MPTLSLLFFLFFFVGGGHFLIPPLAAIYLVTPLDADALLLTLVMSQRQAESFVFTTDHLRFG